MKKLICKLVGRKWRPYTPKEIDALLSKKTVILVCCERCGFNFNPHSK